MKAAFFLFFTACLLALASCGEANKPTIETGTANNTAVVADAAAD